jgi:hypothetical protein
MSGCFDGIDEENREAGEMPARSRHCKGIPLKQHLRMEPQARRPARINALQP